MRRGLAAAVAALAAVAAGAEPVQVSTRAGVLVGESRDGVRVFKGVPYAQPPVGPLRWAAPRPVAWKGARPAVAFALPCLQPDGVDGRRNGGGHSGPSSEDCLYLNVWAPAAAKKAPIMLWLYGGGGTMGGGHLPAYNGDAFARDGVVLVTINYRLGALGGFAHPALTRAGEGFGNYHLLDAMAALRWIKANAAAFGGDPGNITVFGESAGATMVANLVTSPMAKGLFAKAIIQSTGSLPTPATPLKAAEARGAEVATLLGLPGAEASAGDLRALPADRIILDRRTGFGHRTILDGRVKTQSIMEAFSAGTALDVPLMIGTNSDEGRLSGTQRVAAYAMGGAPVWQYFFDYVPEWRRTEQPNGVPHAGEIPYVFDTLSADRAGARMTPRDHAVAARVHGCWVAFAKAAASARSLACADGFEWPARSDANGGAVAIFEDRPRLGVASALRSPPNGAKPGPTSRDEE
ncbi:MAG: carboxylesterase/lipase family protein [Phenylobacterium sp.]|uniref:carboxylesterase/lipase family protein n=1 Tax=Phenylobacterium sp. TaxID=1871053 RepID=UPI001A3E42DF|nr:carboxylesterase family protein [Phenylobacterium sp.]MBL8771541.1 carboxylesterase/lipase family protein [Phenylobacterium sp.]